MQFGTALKTAVCCILLIFVCGLGLLRIVDQQDVTFCNFAQDVTATAGSIHLDKANSATWTASNPLH